LVKNGRNKRCFAAFIPTQTADTGGFSLFPNPVSNELSVIFNLKNVISLNFRIFNIFGQVFLAKNVVDSRNENLFQVDLTEIPNGVYFLEITLLGQSPSIQKFIIQK
jgi:Secretion system C-terminal sorting domain